MRVSGPILQHNYTRTTQNGFGGINNNLAAGNGEILAMQNMTSDCYPLLQTRQQGLKREGYAQGMISCYAFDIYDGKTAWIGNFGGTVPILHYSGEARTSLPLGTTVGERQMVKLGTTICIWPDKWFYDVRAADAKDYSDRLIIAVPSTEEYDGNIVTAQHNVDDEYVVDYFIWQDGWEIFTAAGTMEAFAAPRDAVFEDGTFAGQPAERNTIKFSKTYAAAWTANWRLNVGDAVEISGALNKENNKIAVIKEIGEDATYIYLRFLEGTFVNNSSDDEITITRKVPDLKFVCEHKNRLWGCTEREIFCSHLGDGMNWYEYESLADGAWAVEIGHGEMTACCSYKYPLFFTENEIYTILGDSPMEYTMSVTPNTYGCAKGSHKSLAVVREYLFYHSPYGFCYYYGSLPQICSDGLGTEYFFNAIGGGKGHKYYVSCDDEKGNPHNFVFDSKRGVWHEDVNAWGTKNGGYAWDGDLYVFMGDGIYTADDPRHAPSDTKEFGILKMPSLVKFAPWDIGTVNKKQIKSICIRHKVSGTLTVKLYQDGVENVSLRKTITGEGMTEIVGIPRRSDRWYLQMEGAGDWTVYSIAYDYYEGSAK